MTVRSLLRTALVAGVMLAGYATVPSTDVNAVGGSFTKHTVGSRDYWLYLPPGQPMRRPLVVYLHGCTQTAPDAALGSRWNALAEARGFAVLYPEQPPEANGARCWNWFHPDHQRRDAGEPAVLASLTRAVVAGHRLDHRRVYVFGVSAGADMATTLAAAYPDLYAAMGAFAGCPYLTCADLSGAAAYQLMAGRARVMPTFLVQGTADPLNNLAMGQALAAQWVGTNDLADDGEPNGSVTREPSSLDHFGVGPQILNGAGTTGDPCVRNFQWPCPGAALGWTTYPHTVARHSDAQGCAVVENWVIHGLAHNYPGGDPQGTFTDPIGPDITTAAYDFFTRHTRAGTCT